MRDSDEQFMMGLIPDIIFSYRRTLSMNTDEHIVCIVSRIYAESTLQLGIDN